MHKTANYRRLLIRWSSFLRSLQTLHLHGVFYSMSCPGQLWVGWNYTDGSIFQEIKVQFDTYTFSLLMITFEETKAVLPFRSCIYPCGIHPKAVHGTAGTKTWPCNSKTKLNLIYYVFRIFHQVSIYLQYLTISICKTGALVYETSVNTNLDCAKSALQTFVFSLPLSTNTEQCPHTKLQHK